MMQMIGGSPQDFPLTRPDILNGRAFALVQRAAFKLSLVTEITGTQ